MTITGTAVTATVNTANVIAEIQAVSPFSVQTLAEAGAGTNLTANILYATAGRKQGNFTRFLATAQLKLAQDETRMGKSLTTAQRETLLAYLIASAQEKKDPDYAARSVSMSGYSVSRADGRTGYEVAYQTYMDSLPNADISATLNAEDTTFVPVAMEDHAAYPDEWRMSNLHGKGSSAASTTLDDPI